MLTKEKREWEIVVDASLAVAKIGVGGDLDTTNLKSASARNGPYSRVKPCQDGRRD